MPENHKANPFNPKHHQVHWDWTISFGNMLSVAVTVGTIVTALIAGYIRYEKRLDEVERRTSNHDRALSDVAHALNLHDDDPGKHMPDREKYLLWVQRAEFEAEKAKTEKELVEARSERAKIEATIRAEVRAEFAEIKSLIREASREQSAQMAVLTNRIDSLHTPRQ